MKHILRYQGFSPQERLDEILDKITNYGLASLNESESEFLKSYSTYNENDIHKKLSLTENENIFLDDNGKFTFEYKTVKNYRNRKDIYGTIYVPDMKYKGQVMKGRLEGKISKYKNGNVSLYFDNNYPDECDIFEFCSGIEYELDAFIDYVVQEVCKKGIGY